VVKADPATPTHRKVFATGGGTFRPKMDRTPILRVYFRPG
jgi:hypothetical protein